MHIICINRDDGPRSIKNAKNLQLKRRSLLRRWWAGVGPRRNQVFSPNTEAGSEPCQMGGREFSEWDDLVETGGLIDVAREITWQVRCRLAGRGLVQSENKTQDERREGRRRKPAWNKPRRRSLSGLADGSEHIARKEGRGLVLAGLSQQIPQAVIFGKLILHAISNTERAQKFRKK